MNLARKVRHLVALYRQLDRDIDRFARCTGLACLPGCSACCHKPDLTASVLEFLPLAWHLARTGRAEAMREHLATLHHHTPCVLLDATNLAGGCSMYPHRGLVCRLFGFSVEYDKTDRPRLVTCRAVKDDCPELIEHASTLIDAGLPVVAVGRRTLQFASVDFTLANDIHPINQAILRAIDIVLLSRRLRRAA